MTGVPGRSGKATTLEAKRAKAAGGAKGGRGRANSPALPPSTATDPLSDDPLERLGKPLTWGDELKRAQVDGERTQNRRREVEVQRAEVELSKAQDERALARGDLLTREQHREAVASVVAAIIEASSTLTASAVSMHQPEQQPMARHQFESALAEWRAAAMALIKCASK